MRSLLVTLSLGTSTLFAEGGAGGFDIMQFAPILLIFVIFYFLIMRPQQKKASAHQAMLKELRRGDKVVTAGGILGTVDKIISDTELSLEIAEGVKVRVVKATVTEVFAKTHPVTENTKNASASESHVKLAHSNDEPVKSEETAKKVQVKSVSAKAAPKKPTKK